MATLNGGGWLVYLHVGMILEKIYLDDIFTKKKFYHFQLKVKINFRSDTCTFQTENIRNKLLNNELHTTMVIEIYTIF